MPNQSDYGTAGDESTLVPGTLTAYRHFLLDTTTGALASPSGHQAAYNPDAQPWGAECKVFQSKPQPPSWYCWENYTRGERCDHEGCARQYRSTLDRYEFDMRRWEKSQVCPTPDVDCRCGFYAHYHSGTDFYEYEMWLPLGWDDAARANLNYPTRPDTILVRTVVELSGKIVMGRLGVRAQKMRVLAMATDWAKFATGEVKVKTTPLGFADYSPVTGREYCPVADAYDAKTAAAAHVYGAKYYADVDKMYADFPQPDLSALGITRAEPEPAGYIDQALKASMMAGSPPPPPSWATAYANGGIYATSTVAKLKPASMTISANFDPKALSGLLDNIKAAFYNTPIDTNGLRPTPMLPTGNAVWDAAITAKRNRPAPPGSGINRRKGKLK